MNHQWIGYGIAAIIIAALVALSVWFLMDGLGGGAGPTRIAPPKATVEAVVADRTALPVVYRNDFSQTAGKGLSAQRIERTPTGEKPFLGQFNNETVTLNISDLPEHALLRIAFDLYIIDTWDGMAPNNGGARIGPDFWSMALGDGRMLLHHTFSNTPDVPGFAQKGKFQTYPAPVPAEPAPSTTGATATKTMGYVYHATPTLDFPMDSVYPIDLVVPHSTSEVQIDFAAAELQGIEDEGWGIANLRIEALGRDAVAVPSADELARHWETLAGDTAEAAAKAFWSMVAGGDATVEFLRSHVHSLGLDRAAAQAQIQSLAQGDSAARSEAQWSLIRRGPVVEPLVREAMVGASYPQRKALMDVLEGIVVRPVRPAGARAAAGASRLLQIIGTPAAKTLWNALADAPVSGDLTSIGSTHGGDDWWAAFTAVYYLAPGQALKFVPHPPIPQRLAYWNARAARLFPNSGTRMPLADTQTMVFWLDDPEAELTSAMAVMRPAGGAAAGQPGPLSGLLRSLRLAESGSKGELKVVVPAELENLYPAGDWLVRRTAKQAETLPELVKVLSAQSGRSVRLERQSVEMQCVVISGTYQFQPLSDGQPADTLDVFADHRSGSPGGSGPLRFLYSRLAVQTGIPWIDESVSGSQFIKWTMDPSTAMRGSEEPAKLDLLLANLSKQTGLTFKREQRRQDMFVLVAK